jgi:8-oxo-dGTP pyrophosphatase MutT (NUDIX family)
MTEKSPLPLPPSIRVKVLRDLPAAERPFVWVRGVELANEYADGSVSKPYPYYLAERTLLDAVCLALWRRGPEGFEMVVRSQLRPPLAFRHLYDVPLAADGTGAVQWEVPAGLVELGERGLSGLCERAAAEALEEVGVRLPAERFAPLGPASSLSPGLIAEKLHFVHAEIVASDEHGAASGDGHPVEEQAVSVFVPLKDAVRAVDMGIIHDVKTEVAIRRLCALLGAERA